MEDDYKIYSPKIEETLDELGIDYVWRDSCVDVLIETKKCMKSDFTSSMMVLNRLSLCKGIQDLWKDCEKNREIKLLDVYFTKYTSYEKTISETNSIETASTIY